MPEDHKKIYRAYANDHHLPIFYQPDYLDAACAEASWDVFLAITEDKKIEGYWPYFIKSRFGLRTIALPSLTHYLGPQIIVPPELTKENSIRSYHRRVLKSLHDGLPLVSRIMVQTYPTFSNWRPLSWSNYHQTTRYTLNVDLRKREEELYAALKDKIRNQIKQADKLFQVEETSSPELLYQLSESTFARQGRKVPYSFETFERIHKMIESQGKGLGYVIKEGGQTKAGVFVARDHDTAYLMITGRVTDAHSGGVALLIWESIRAMKNLGIKTYDFEGSMNQGIASFFDAFGGKLVPYHRLTRARTRLHRLAFQVIGKI